MEPTREALMLELRRVIGVAKAQHAMMAVLVGRLGGDVTITPTDLRMTMRFETTPLGNYHLTSQLHLDNPDTPA